MYRTYEGSKIKNPNYNVQKFCKHCQSEMNVLLQLRFGTLAVWTVVFPLFSFVFCVMWSLVYNFSESTSTHCRVTNYLPSLSAAIGGYTPQRYVWRIGIAVHCAPRFLVAVMYYNHNNSTVLKQSFWQWLTMIAFIFHFIEVTSLIGLTYISSTENFPMHENFFVIFMICALGNMLLLCVLRKYGGKHQLTMLEKKSLKCKSILGVINVLACFLAVYFYFRHNWYCEPGVYTLFALSEYVVVLTNIGFHMTSFWDFSDKELVVNSL